MMTPSDLDVALMGYHDKRAIDAHFYACLITATSMGKGSISGKDIYIHPELTKEDKNKLNQFSEEGRKTIDQRISKLFKDGRTS